MEVIQNFSACDIRRFAYFKDGFVVLYVLCSIFIAFYELFNDNVYTYNNIIMFEAGIQNKDGESLPKQDFCCHILAPLGQSKKYTKTIVFILMLLDLNMFKFIVNFEQA